MADDELPVPQPEGSLNPPVRRPPTALAVATPPPPPVPRRPVARRGGAFELVRRGVNLALDALDAAGDAIAQAAGLRPRA